MMTNALRCAALCLVVYSLGGNAVAQSLPSGFATRDIGDTGATGSASGSGASFTVTGAGADIWGTADGFRYVYTMLQGDGSIVARVSSLQYVHNWTKGGVMMRASLTPDSPHATMLVSAGRGLGFQRRVWAGDISLHTAGALAQAPYYVKLTRVGNTFTGSQSADGVTWVTVDSATINMPGTLYVGLAVTSHTYGALATGTFAGVSIAGSTVAPPTTSTVETIVFLRHGEKPSGGYGQITCQGLQRALALPAVLLNRFGTPQFLFAPNPLPKVPDPAGYFHYVRPLATIEPTAIRLGMPVNAQYGYTDIAGLQNELLGAPYVSATIFVAWEHQKLQEVVQNIMNAYGSGVAVPPWSGTDYDSLYIVRLTRTGSTTTAQFSQDYQGLNNLPTTCP